MQLARVIGHATATIKHPTLAGWRLVAVQPLGADRKADGGPYLALDHLGCGRGDLVITSSDGKSTREAVGANNTPARWMIIGLADE